MEDIKMRLQKLKDLQEKKHKKYLEAKYKANKYQKDSYELFWKIEKTQEELMTAKQLLILLLKKTRGTWGDSMTKNTRFNEIKLAMNAGHYANLNKR